MEKKTDRRVRKTKNQLRTGLARLMKKKNIGQITVKELVDDVEILTVRHFICIIRIFRLF